MSPASLSGVALATSESKCICTICFASSKLLLEPSCLITLSFDFSGNPTTNCGYLSLSVTLSSSRNDLYRRVNCLIYSLRVTVLFCVQVDLDEYDINTCYPSHLWADSYRQPYPQTKLASSTLLRRLRARNTNMTFGRKEACHFRTCMYFKKEKEKVHDHLLRRR